MLLQQTTRNWVVFVEKRRCYTFVMPWYYKSITTAFYKVLQKFPSDRKKKLLLITWMKIGGITFTNVILISHS